MILVLLVSSLGFELVFRFGDFVCGVVSLCFLYFVSCGLIDYLWCLVFSASLHALLMGCLFYCLCCFLGSSAFCVCY